MASQNNNDATPAEKLRVIVTVKSGANSELWDALAGVPRDQRSERLRMLATVGAQLCQSRLIAVPVATQAGPVIVTLEQNTKGPEHAPPNDENVSGGIKAMLGRDGALDL